MVFRNGSSFKFCISLVILVVLLHLVLFLMQYSYSTLFSWILALENQPEDAVSFLPSPSVQGVRIKSNPLETIHYLCNCSRFFP